MQAPSVVYQKQQTAFFTPQAIITTLSLYFSTNNPL
jgi:hypothetical protein